MITLLAGLSLLVQQRDSSVVVTDSVVALVGVTVIDGTGAPARPGQTVVIAAGRIRIGAPRRRSRFLPAPRFSTGRDSRSCPA